MMATLGATIKVLEVGVVEVSMQAHSSFPQQNGFIHAGALAAIGDTAGGYAVYCTMDEGADMLATEFKMPLLRPATDHRIVARALVIKPGRMLAVTEIRVFSRKDDR